MIAQEEEEGGGGRSDLQEIPTSFRHEGRKHNHIFIKIFFLLNIGLDINKTHSPHPPDPATHTLQFPFSFFPSSTQKSSALTTKTPLRVASEKHLHTIQQNWDRAIQFHSLNMPSSNSPVSAIVWRGDTRNLRQTTLFLQPKDTPGSFTPVRPLVNHRPHESSTEVRGSACRKLSIPPKGEGHSYRLAKVFFSFNLLSN
ncbi:hypothetical protein CDAR_26181 [Caerostris darwini]|uniref:Uncharacterized protein n=1 Tax=Caerostris darwini TaxID=1538125 RepID=A0AAV4N9B2_9ARAC|nr:hypothetical protein CDAR_26181 [Caerostris darwini]